MLAAAVLPRVKRLLDAYPRSLYARHALAGAARQVADRVRGGQATDEEKELHRRWQDMQNTHPR